MLCYITHHLAKFIRLEPRMDVIWHNGQQYYSLLDIYRSKIYYPEFFSNKHTPDECDLKVVRRSVEKISRDKYILVFRRNASIGTPYIHEEYAQVMFFWEYS